MGYTSLKNDQIFEHIGENDDKLQVFSPNGVPWGRINSSAGQPVGKNDIGGIPTYPSEKSWSEFVSWDDDIPFPFPTVSGQSFKIA